LTGLKDVVDGYDGFLVAGYIDHSLVPLLQSHVGLKPVVGIFQATLTVSLQMITPGSKFGIITTGVQYEAMLTNGVRKFLGAPDGSPDPTVFGGVVATAIAATELDNKDLLKQKVLVATHRLMKRGDVSVICLGGAILVGLENWVRQGCIEVLGEEKGKNIRLVDQMLAGITTVASLARIGAVSAY
jgi:Asp/Glu/hydantoin racemase